MRIFSSLVGASLCTLTLARASSYYGDFVLNQDNFPFCFSTSDLVRVSLQPLHTQNQTIAIGLVDADYFYDGSRQIAEKFARLDSSDFENLRRGDFMVKENMKLGILSPFTGFEGLSGTKYCLLARSMDEHSSGEFSIRALTHQLRTFTPAAVVYAFVTALFSLFTGIWLFLCVKRRRSILPVHWSMFTVLSLDVLLLFTTLLDNTSFGDPLNSDWPSTVNVITRDIRTIAYPFTLFCLGGGFGITGPSTSKTLCRVSAAVFLFLVLEIVGNNVYMLGHNLAFGISGFLRENSDGIVYGLAGIFLYKRLVQVSTDKDVYKTRVYRTVLAIVLVNSFAPALICCIIHYGFFPDESVLTVIRFLLPLIFDIILAYPLLPTGQNVVKLALEGQPITM
ncbi:hypothetical protein SJAG_03203 [Schizosaccharomyces japonicus yFS275]|uniref:GOST seven transmembrane domain-containing protein n=1 Tax=Schizosaccharomyces japonicus (strain yFS275 / FY16936) TaxID=402676 RepID=B6K3L4_SCHJY|nr:hypothetical protein SJAG_03203 [Schizosaccharomyces japonicus yFS275]EEB08071.1 hypothetical protein SJAG_03203 [Schizosaccharomyces japonicus yFS275]